MKRGGYLQRHTPLKRRTPFAAHGKSDTAQVKQAIQAELLRIVLARDGGCFLRGKFGHICSGWKKDGEIVHQADHLIERSNSATYADPRLVVCICKGIHAWKHFKKSNHDQYDSWIRLLLPPERIAHWDRCKADSYHPHRTSAVDWRIELAYLKSQ
jgi:hypothetical protein